MSKQVPQSAAAQVRHRCRSVARPALVAGVLLSAFAGLGIGSASAQAVGPMPDEFDCPAGYTKYAVPRRPEPLRNNVVLPPLLWTSGQTTIDTGVVIPAGRLRIGRYVSWDGYASRPTSGVQAHEQWALRVGGVDTALTQDLVDFTVTAQVVGTLPDIDQPGGTIQIRHAALYMPLSDGASVHAVGFCWTVDPPVTTTTSTTTTSTTLPATTTSTTSTTLPATTTTLPATTSTTLPGTTTTTTPGQTTTTSTPPAQTTTTVAGTTTSTTTTVAGTTSTTAPPPFTFPPPVTNPVPTTTTTPAATTTAPPPAATTTAAPAPAVTTTAPAVAGVAVVDPTTTIGVQVLGEEIINVTTGDLSLTGSSSGPLVLVALMSITAGAAALLGVRLRRR